MTSASKIDLSVCAREPIHLAGAVQPFGAMLGIRPDDRRAILMSENAASVLGVPAETLRDRPIDALVSAEDGETVRSVIDDLASERVVTIGVGSAESAHRRFWLSLHRAGSMVIAEFEPAMDTAQDGHTDALLMSAAGAIESAPNVREICALAADHVRRISGYDRVMVYRFAPDWSGEVVAESRAAGLTPYLGLHYPASDIPQQARTLYLRNRLRVIADVGAPPSALRVIDGRAPAEPTDLSLSWLRQPSPTHVEYLTNMGVRATLTMSLLREGALWGLIACHHHTPRRPTARSRAACALLAQIVSLQTPVKEREEEREETLRLSVTLEAIVRRAGEQTDITAALMGERPNLLDLVHAGGVVTMFGGRTQSAGAVPSQRVIDAVVRWFERTASGDVLHTDALPAAIPEAAGEEANASGVLALRLSQREHDLVMWFRPEVVREVAWGGDPNHPAEIRDNMRVHPRKSFAAWREQVRETSAAWRACDVATARRLAAGVRDALLQRASEWARLNRELADSNRGLREALDALRQSEARLHAAFDNLDALFWVIDDSGRFVTQNRACSDAWGALGGRTLDDAPINADFRRRLLDLHHRAAGGEIIREEVENAAGPEQVWFEVLVAPVRTNGRSRGAVGVAIDIRERKRAEIRQRMMASELDHRVRNNLAAVISLVHQSAADSVSLPAFVETVSGRIRALARAHNLLSAGAFDGAGLMQLLRMALEPHLIGDRPAVTLEGPDLRLPTPAVSPLVFALHELAINASKHGALATPEGRVALRWRVERASGEAASLCLRWQERGGSPVVRPASKGFGITLIEGLITHEAGGVVAFAFPPEGVECEITIPLGGMTAATPR